MLTKEQKEKRSKGIGGSEIAAIAGLNKWMAPIDVWEAKVIGKEELEGFNIERGNFLEPVLIDWYEHRTGNVVDRVQEILVHPEYEIVIATPDGLIHELKRTLEIKSPGPYNDDWSEGVPDMYLPQTMWEMAVSGYNETDVAALIKGDLQVFNVKFHKPMFDALLKIANDFWSNYVLTETRPPVDNSKSYSEYLGKTFQKNKGEYITASGEEQGFALQYIEAKANLKKAQEQIDYLKNRFKDSIKDNDGLVTYFGRIDWKAHNKKTVNWKAIAKELNIEQKIIDKHTKTSIVRPLNDYLKNNQEDNK